MQLHEIQPTHKRRKSRRIGRGGKKGTYSGRGMKGQVARAGARFQPLIRYVIKKYPKLRGSKAHTREERKVAVVNVETLERCFEKGETVHPRSLMEKGLLVNREGRMPKVKILGSGTLTKALVVEDCQVSGSAKEKIEKAGGSIQST